MLVFLTDTDRYESTEYMEDVFDKWKFFLFISVFCYQESFCTVILSLLFVYTCNACKIPNCEVSTFLGSKCVKACVNLEFFHPARRASLSLFLRGQETEKEALRLKSP